MSRYSRVRIALRRIRTRLLPMLRIVKIPIGRLRYLPFIRPRFSGAFDSREAATDSVPPGLGTHYDSNDVVEISYTEMCQIMPWDYPVLYWLQRLLPQAGRLLDAGGHMGTKYRAFRPYLDLATNVEWTVYDVPAVVLAGRELAKRDRLEELNFVDQLNDIETPEILLASGLLQYLDIPFSELLGRLPQLPEKLLINKVAWRSGRTIFTLEDFSVARIPYQIRNRTGFLQEMERLGYRIVDEWQIPSLSHQIGTHPELGSSFSSGFYMKLAGPT